VGLHCSRWYSQCSADRVLQVKDRSNAAVYIVVESRLGQFPVKFKASGKKQAPSKGNNVEAVQDGLDKESYELLAKILGSSLDGLKDCL